jgi:hypothetical protein
VRFCTKCCQIVIILTQLIASVRMPEIGEFKLVESKWLLKLDSIHLIGNTDPSVVRPLIFDLATPINRQKSQFWLWLYSLL